MATSPAPCHGGSPSARAYMPRGIQGTDGVETCKPRELGMPSVHLASTCTTRAGLATPHSSGSSPPSTHARTWRDVAGIDTSLGFPDMDRAASCSQGEVNDERLAQVQTRARAVGKDAVTDNIATLDSTGWTQVATETLCSKQALPPPPPSKMMTMLSARGVSSENDAPVKEHRGYGEIARAHQSRPVGRTVSKVTGEKPGTGEGKTDEDSSICRAQERIIGAEIAFGRESSTVRAGSCTAGLFEELLDPGVISIYCR